MLGQCFRVVCVIYVRYTARDFYRFQRVISFLQRVEFTCASIRGLNSPANPFCRAITKIEVRARISRGRHTLRV